MKRYWAQAQNKGVRFAWVTDERFNDLDAAIDAGQKLTDDFGRTSRVIDGFTGAIQWTSGRGRLSVADQAIGQRKADEL